MPVDRSKYPPDWETTTARIRERAGNVCEWPGCGLPNGLRIHRLRANPEVWGPAEDDAPPVGCYAVKVVLTVAHLDEGGPLDSPDDRLAALCQLHHLRLDAKLHARNAAATRRQKRIAGGQQVLA